MKDSIAKNLGIVRERINAACIKSGRAPSDVKLLLATKTVTAERIIVAVQQGTILTGENKVQEIKEKYEALQQVPHEKHFIGHLQTNKIKELLKYDINCIQSIDRWEAVEKLHQRLAMAGRQMDVLIQVNTSGESSKFGVRPEECTVLVQRVAELNTLCIKGLMTIGLWSTETEKVRYCFKILRELRDEIAAKNIYNVEMKELSMGMSGDLEAAIEEGATIVRVGTAIFGERAYPDSYYWNEKEQTGT